MEDVVLDPEREVKKPYPANAIINWYLGNFIESPNNGIRDDSFEVDIEDWKPVWFEDIENIRNELKGKLITHSDFFRLMKERGIQDKYYNYKRYENHCEICKALGIK